MSATTEIGEYLEDQSVGTVGTDLFLGRLPTTPAEAMAIVPYPGRAPEHHMTGDGAIAIEFPRFQFLSRATTEATALSNAHAAFVALAKVSNQIIEGTFYSTITPLQSPGILRWDGNDRPIVVFNFESEKAPGAGGGGFTSGFTGGFG